MQQQEPLQDIQKAQLFPPEEELESSSQQILIRDSSSPEKVPLRTKTSSKQLNQSYLKRKLSNVNEATRQSQSEEGTQQVDEDYEKEDFEEEEEIEDEYQDEDGVESDTKS